MSLITSLKMLTITGKKKKFIKLFKSLKISRQGLFFFFFFSLLLGTENVHIHLYSENVMVSIFIWPFITKMVHSFQDVEGLQWEWGDPGARSDGERRQQGSA